MFQTVWRVWSSLAFSQIARAGYELVTIGQDSARDERRIFELLSTLEREVDALGDLINNPVRDEDLYPDLRIRCLECSDQGRKQRVGDAGWRREAQFA